ncbi:MAG: anti-sigma factor [Telmatospirillum sp.]|nr:anti-sigma factor [Telmatospirillum sp.]
MTCPSYHPPDEMLMAYGTGSLDEASSLLIATHLTLCRRCRIEVERIEAMGGGLLDSLAPESLSEGALARVMTRLDGPPARSRPPQTAAVAGMPAPLWPYIAGGVDALPWRRVGPGIQQVFVASGPIARARMLRVAPGVVIPQHGHAAGEMTMVLRGGFADAGQTFEIGDIEVAGPETIHRPASDPEEGCLCLAVTDGPLRLTGLLGRLLNPFLDL